MKITDVRAVSIEVEAAPATKPRVPRLSEVPEMVNPMHRYPEITRAEWYPSFTQKAACVITVEDGTWGLGTTMYSCLLYTSPRPRARG